MTEVCCILSCGATNEGFRSLKKEDGDVNFDEYIDGLRRRAEETDQLNVDI